MATPQVTGAVAVLHSVGGPSFAALRTSDPAAAALEIKNALLSTVDVVPTLDGFTVSGGRMNLRAAADVIAGFDGGAVGYADHEQLHGRRGCSAPRGASTSRSTI